MKNYHWLDLVKGLFAAYEQGADTAILVDMSGKISDGPGFNIFSVADGKISTPGHGVLKGITRQTVFDICRRSQVKCVADSVSPDQLKQSDEVFVTSTAGGIMPVTKIDSTPIGLGTPGPVTKRIAESYWRMHEDARDRMLVEYPKSSQN